MVGRKPYWFGEKESELSSGCRRHSKTLIAWKRREMRRYLAPKSAGLLGLGTGVIIECFQMAGILQWLVEKVSEVLKS